MTAGRFGNSGQAPREPAAAREDCKGGRGQHSTRMPWQETSSLGQPSHKETTGFTDTKNKRAKPDEGELITKAIYPTFAAATHRQPMRSDVLLMRMAASLNKGRMEHN